MQDRERLNLGKSPGGETITTTCVFTRGWGPALHREFEAYGKLTSEGLAALGDQPSRALRQVPARRDLLREGEPATSVYILLEGWASRYKTMADGRRQVVAFFLPGDVFDTHVLPLQLMDHSIAAITALSVAEIERAEFDALLESRPDLARALWRQDSMSIAVQREWTFNVGQRTAFERIAHILCEIFLRLRHGGRTQGNACDFPLTQVDLADATALTPVHVNRTLQEMRRDGLIELQHRVLVIPDLAALQAAGMFNPAYLQLGALRV